MHKTVYTYILKKMLLAHFSLNFKGFLTIIQKFEPVCFLHFFKEVYYAFFNQK